MDASARRWSAVMKARAGAAGGSGRVAGDARSDSHGSARRRHPLRSRWRATLLHIHQHLAIFDHGQTASGYRKTSPAAAGRLLFIGCIRTRRRIIHVESPTSSHGNYARAVHLRWGQPLFARTSLPRAKGRVRNAPTVWVDEQRSIPEIRSTASNVEAALSSRRSVSVAGEKPAPFAA